MRSHKKGNTTIKKMFTHIPRKKVIVILVAVVMISLGVLLAGHMMQNPAAEVVRSVGGKLVANGAVEQCGSGDAGFGPDNYSPHYGADYLVAKDKDQAVALIQEVATESGFALVHASKSNRGHLNSIADAYIDQWYFDDSKQSQYLFLKSGRIQLAVSIRASGDRNPCDQSVIPDGSTVVSIGAQLPERRF